MQYKASTLPLPKTLFYLCGGEDSPKSDGDVVYDGSSTAR